MRAEIGPRIQIVNAANDPKKAIVELNPGIRMDTQTETTGSKARSKMKNERLTTFLDDNRWSLTGVDLRVAYIDV
jgi:hypothetical protein